MNSVNQHTEILAEKLKFSENSSYWIKREKNIGPMKKQF